MRAEIEEDYTRAITARAEAKKRTAGLMQKIKIASTASLKLALKNANTTGKSLLKRLVERELKRREIYD